MVKRYAENKKGVGIFIDTEMKILDVKKFTNNWEIESMKKDFSFLWNGIFLYLSAVVFYMYSWVYPSPSYLLTHLRDLEKYIFVVATATIEDDIDEDTNTYIFFFGTTMDYFP